MTLQDKLRNAAYNAALDIGTAWNLLEEAANALEKTTAERNLLRRELSFAHRVLTDNGIRCMRGDTDTIAAALAETAGCVPSRASQKK